MGHALVKPFRAVVALLLAATTSAVAVAAAPVGFEVVAPFEARTFLEHSQFNLLGGIAVDAGGTMYVGDWQTSGLGRIYRIDVATRSISTLHEAPPINGPGRIVVGDGRAATGHDLIVADDNSTPTHACCNGSVWRVDRTTGAHALLVIGNGGATVTGDPWGLALGPGGAFGDGIYVMDYQGASPDLPLLFRIVAEGGGYAAQTMLQSQDEWTTERIPIEIAFGGPRFGGDLFVLDPSNAGGPPRIWRVDGGGSLGSFVAFDNGDVPAAMKFGPGGFFGTNLYVLMEDGDLVAFAPDGAGTTIAVGVPLVAGWSDLAFTPDGNRLFVTAEDAIAEIVAPAERRVSIDIKPNTTPNSINMGSHGNFVVGILSSANFDAKEVDVGTVTLAGASVARRPSGTMMASIRDVNGDGKPDLLVHIVTDQLQLDSGADSAVLKGMTASGGAFWGIDSVRLVP